ncbi:MAG: hypothetical protein RIT23_1295 [Actinomycetota bacterium]|jgi:hypothetical protein
MLGSEPLGTPATWPRSDVVYDEPNFSRRSDMESNDSTRSNDCETGFRSRHVTAHWRE